MNKTILITGSSRGIGKAIAKLAYKQGYKVIVHGKTDSKELTKSHKELKGSVKTFFDVSDKSEVHKKITKLGHIDVLVNNAGIAMNFLKDINEVDDEKALEEYKVNVLGAIHCIQAVLPGMLKKGKGSVVNISSIKGFAQLATMSTLTFAPTKSGITSITKSLAKAYSSKGIRFNSVAPGYVETDQVKLWNKETFKRINEGTLLGRMAKPEEIAPLVMFLASDEASYITGSEILIDGGYMLKGK
jgi:3-oxoacyl-[acyl-carrier protein] reductase